MNRLELKLPPALLFVLVAIGMWGLARVTLRLEIAPLLESALVLALFIAAAWIGISAVAAFRRAGTTASPIRPQGASSLVTGGVYQHSRNPMYLALLLLLLAWAVWLAAPWALLGPVVFVAWMTRFQIRPEERALGVHFGPDYQDYCRRTSRWLSIPGAGRHDEQQG
ncbi:MAG TPA: isoprenylcysteine carboxylmethyltransferase family protein [Wenzhouxiangella sp.]|nr:isoprenylcysteine carboxylmethyltransferase family protein [Wenzhouxiangella sp.]